MQVSIVVVLMLGLLLMVQSRPHTSLDHPEECCSSCCLEPNAAQNGPNNNSNGGQAVPSGPNDGLPVIQELKMMPKEGSHDMTKRQVAAVEQQPATATTTQGQQSVADGQQQQQQPEPVAVKEQGPDSTPVVQN